MKTFLLLILVGTLVSCSAVKDGEASAPVIRLGAKPPSCAFPKDFKTEENVVAAVTCLESNLDNAFASLITKTEGELSVRELQKLQREGIIELSVTTNEQWNGIAGLISLVHPEGKSAISRKEIGRFTAFLKKKASFLAKVATSEKYEGKKAPFQQAFFQESVDFFDELVSFLSDGGSLSLEQSQALVALARVNRPAESYGKIDVYLPALWRLKALILESTRAEDKIVGASLKTFLKTGVEIARHGKETYVWWDEDFHPASTPAHIEKEWSKMLELAKQYFGSTRTFDLDSDEMRAQVRVLLPEAEFPEQIPDLVKVSKKLLEQKGDSHQGLMYGLLHLFDGSEKVAVQLRDASKLFCRCKVSEPCSISLRLAMKLKPTALVSGVSSKDWNLAAVKAGTPTASTATLPKRLESRIEWKIVLRRLMERGVIANVFAAYDRNADAQIPYLGKSEEDLNEAMDVAFSIISLINSRGNTPSSKEAPLYLKPATIIGTVGLLADEWVIPGNRDGKINLDEFFFSLKIYEDINFIARQGSLSLKAYADSYESARHLNPADKVYVSRPAVLRYTTQVFEQELPYLHAVGAVLEKEHRGARELMDVLVPQHEEELKLYSISNPSQASLRKDYVERADLMASVSLFVLLDRLIVKCDRNEDELFSYDELGCVSPLALKAGRQMLNSDVIPLPQFAKDSGNLAVDTLEQPGLPETLAKVVLMNGGISTNRISDTHIRIAKERVQATTPEVARLFESLSKKSVDTLRKETSVAVIYSKSTFRGAYANYWSGGDAKATDIIDSVAAWDSVTENLIVEGIIANIVEQSDGTLNKTRLVEIWNNLGKGVNPKYEKFAAIKTLLPFSIVVGSRPTFSVQVFNDRKGASVSKMDPVSPARVLGLIHDLVK